MTQQRVTLTATIAFCVLFVPRAAAAIVLHDTFTLVDQYELFAGNHVARVGPDISDPQGRSLDAAHRFRTPAGSAYALAQIELAVSLLAGPNELDVLLMTDVPFRLDGYGAPGQIIESFHFSDAMGPLGSANALLVGHSTIKPVLNPDTRYWLVASASHVGTVSTWNSSFLPFGPLNDPESFLAAGVLGQPFPGRWDVFNGAAGAYRVSGEPAAPIVPEPSSLILLGIGLVGITGGRRYRK